MHNFWLLILSEQGLPGLLAYVALFWRGVVGSLRMVRYASDSGFYAVGLSCLFALIYYFTASLGGGGHEMFILPLLSCMAHDVWRMEQSSTATSVLVR